MKRDVKKVLVIGSGPIVIGQAAEFDYSGSQALKAMKEEGVKTVLVNSNPATIQTDRDMADAVYIEPLTPEIVEKVIEKEKPDGILSGMGGQTALNIISELAERGVLEKHNVQVLGTPVDTIETSENRELFKQMMLKIGEPVPKSKSVNTVQEALDFAEEIGYPVVVRPAYTLGGSGGGIAHDFVDLERIAGNGISLSRIGQVLIEEYLSGWKEIEYEVMRDSADNCITICNMENLDPMGIHTGDSIVVAPSQTLSDDDYHMLRSASLKIIRALKVEGGCNIQFALDPKSSDYRIIEVNPRVSRSSALASKATGYPIALISAKIAIGRTLGEIPNAVTKDTPASFEPALDYIVVKIPRWPFEKFPMADRTLGTEMRSTGEVMAIGRTFEEALDKAVRSLDIGKKLIDGTGEMDKGHLREFLTVATHKRLFHIVDAIKSGFSDEEIVELTKIDPWFIWKVRSIVESGDGKKKKCYKMVDTCAAEFEAKTPYYYSTEGDVSESVASNKKKIIILGSGPIRIGQGIEFDYCTVHAVWALREMGIETIVINNNPETVSTDYDTSDKLYFEPLDFEHVMNVVNVEKPTGIITQFGGQTAVNLSLPLEKAGVKVFGTSPKSMDLAEDRTKFTKVLKKLKIPQANYGVAHSFEDAKKVVASIGYPVLVRPSYVLGGRAMEIVHSEDELVNYMKEARKVSEKRPILIDQFLQNAIEVDVDAVCDGSEVLIGGIMEHIEQAGVHSGDSSCVVPPQSLSNEIVKKIRDYTKKLALGLNVVGLMNVQYAVKDEVVYVLEANPRSSRTVPFISKATGIPLAKIAAQVIAGKKLKELKVKNKILNHVSVKSVVFPFNKLPGSDTKLGPEMKSTGESMGIADSFPEAFYKAQLGAGVEIPSDGCVFFAVNHEDKEHITEIARGFEGLGFEILAVGRTAKILRVDGVSVRKVFKASEGNLNIVDLIKRGEVDLVINTPTKGGSANRDGYKIRTACIRSNVPCITTLAGARAALKAIENAGRGGMQVKPLGDYY
ncbi:MAG: carbamoyl-phosphate synthase large subunit [archaeon]